MKLGIRRRVARLLSSANCFDRLMAQSELLFGFHLNLDRLYSALFREAFDDPTVDIIVKLLLKHLEDQLDLRFSYLDLLLSVLELFELLTP